MGVAQRNIKHASVWDGGAGVGKENPINELKSHIL